MGFDMHVVDEQGDSIDECDKPEHGDHYWRRNIWGGARQAQLLVDAGLGYWSPIGDAPWPEPADYGVTANENYDYDDPEQPQWLGARVQEFEAARFAYVKATNDERPGIAANKLCNTNDGWWITRAECQSALKLWEKAGCPDVDDFGDGPHGDTIPFLKAAADHAGFRVW